MPFDAANLEFTNFEQEPSSPESFASTVLAAPKSFRSTNWISVCRRPERFGFQEPRFGQYLAAVQRLDRLAEERFGKRAIHLAVRWMLD
jgi:hypothetical protein